MVPAEGRAELDDVRVLDFKALSGWADDDLDAALAVFKQTCTLIDGPDWQPICKVAQEHNVGRSFFELFFRPVLIEGKAPALFTGYFEPELNGSLRRTGPYRYPLYRLPPGGTGASRAEIENGLLSGRGLEIAWVDDPVELFFLQIQGSGRIRLPDGNMMRVGYAGANGHEYRSVGQELVRRGIFNRHQVSARVIKTWVRRNPEAGRALLQHNPSFVFFRKVTRLPPEKGPIGAMNRSVTDLRTIAVDPAFTPLGAPVWIEKNGRNPLRRLMVAQDTGSAIKGPQRADIFFGTGDAAGEAAGQVRDPGRMLVLLPIQTAFALGDGD